MGERRLRGESPWDVLPGIEEVLREGRHKARREWGQNFLMSRDVCDVLVDFLPPLREGGLLEVGPGPGGLTRSLLSHHDVDIVAVEKDRRCVEMLSSLERYASPRLRVIEGDALLCDLKGLVKEPRYLQSNLPFGVGTPLLQKLLREAGEWEEWVVMVQWEVGERLCALPRTKSYGRMSVWVQGLCEVENLMRVESTLFFPPPKVDGMMVRIRPHGFVKQHADRVSEVWACVEELLSLGFEGRRKTLNRSWGRLGEVDEEVLGSFGLEGGMRAEEVDVSTYWRLGAYVAEKRRGSS